MFLEKFFVSATIYVVFSSVRLSGLPGIFSLDNDFWLV